MPNLPTLAEIVSAIELAWLRHATVRNMGLMIAGRLRFRRTVPLPLPPWLEVLLWAFLAVLVLLGDTPIREAKREDLLTAALQVIRDRTPGGGIA